MYMFVFVYIYIYIYFFFFFVFCVFVLLCFYTHSQADGMIGAGPLRGLFEDLTVPIAILSVPRGTMVKLRDCR